MKSKNGFTLLNLKEFETWLNQTKVGRTIRTVQQHHTYTPSYTHFNGNNHFELQRGMQNYHVHNNGWQDIGQHFTTFPDGTIITGRSLEKSPACIYGFNANSICFEHLGNFDADNDVMTQVHKETIVKITSLVCAKFNIPINTDRIVYHHWFDLATGKRNDGTKRNKSCPGTNFFGGNKVENSNSNFIPLVKLAQTKPTDQAKPSLIKHAIVTATKLNIRRGPGTSHIRVKGRLQLQKSAILRVYEINNGWYKISSSSEHWVSGRYTQEVIPAIVTATKLNVRTGPSTSNKKISSVKKGEEVWVYQEKNDWCRISYLNQWVHKKYLSFD